MRMGGNASLVQENYDYINGTAQSINGDDSWMDFPHQFGDIFCGKIDTFDHTFSHLNFCFAFSMQIMNFAYRLLALMKNS